MRETGLEQKSELKPGAKIDGRARPRLRHNTAMSVSQSTPPEPPGHRIGRSLCVIRTENANWRRRRG